MIGVCFFETPIAISNNSLYNKKNNLSTPRKNLFSYQFFNFFSGNSANKIDHGEIDADADYY